MLVIFDSKAFLISHLDFERICVYKYVHINMNKSVYLNSSEMKSQISEFHFRTKYIYMNSSEMK